MPRGRPKQNESHPFQGQPLAKQDPRRRTATGTEVSA